MASYDHDIERLPRDAEGYGLLPKYNPELEGL